MAAPAFCLDLIEVPSPCSVPWQAMTGNDRVRHCGQCEKNVYNLSNMSRGEAEALVLASEGELCVQFYRRADGTVVTRDCAAVRWSRAVVSTITIACLSVLTLFGLIRVSSSAPANSTFLFVGGGVPAPSTWGQNQCTASDNEPKENEETRDLSK